MSTNESFFRKENLDLYLKELAKTYRKLNGKSSPTEIVLVGGASILINYNFRSVTRDVDAFFVSYSAMKEAINQTGDKFGLPNGWMNTDFMKSKSYSPKLIEHSSYYKTFYGVLEVRTVTAEYMIAMKLMAGREYKNDLSDVIGILKYHADHGAPISIDRIRKAAEDLYGNWSMLPSSSQDFIEDLMSEENYDELFNEIQTRETANKQYLQIFEVENPGVLKEDNLEEILRLSEEKESAESNDQSNSPIQSPGQSM